MLCVETQLGYISPSFGHNSRCILTVMFQPTERKRSKFSIKHYRISRPATVSRELIYIYIYIYIYKIILYLCKGSFQILTFLIKYEHIL